MPNIPLWQLGRHLTSVVITGQNVGTSGALTDSTSSATLTAKINGLDEALTPTKQEINALNTTRENNVVVSDGFSFNLNILKVNDGTDPNPLRTLITNFDYFKLVFVQGTGGSAKTTTAYSSRNAMNASFQGRGSQIATLALDSVDTGTDWIVVS